MCMRRLSAERVSRQKKEIPLEEKGPPCYKKQKLGDRPERGELKVFGSASLQGQKGEGRVLS